jgi:DNA-binding LacI/PurR family transcriptional regulator
MANNPLHVNVFTTTVPLAESSSSSSSQPASSLATPASTSSSNTIKDVAQHAGFSIATVSRAINHPEKVDPLTLAAVRASIEATRYRPSALGRMLRAERSRVIGVVIPTIANPVFGETLQGIDEGTTQAGYRVMLMTTEYDAGREQSAIDTLREHRVDGLILTVADARSNQQLDELDAAQLPYVLAHNDAYPSVERASVAVDNFRAARDGVREMIELGHRRIWMLAGTLAASDRAQQRYAGYAAAMWDAGLTPAPVLESNFAAEHLAPAALTALTTGSERPTALFCSNDRLAMVAIGALVDAGVSVPDTMSVMGFDGLSFGNLLPPRLASICVPNREIGRQAWAGLQSLIDARASRKNAPADADHPDSPAIAPNRTVRLPHLIRPGNTLTAPRFSPALQTSS